MLLKDLSARRDAGVAVHDDRLHAELDRQLGEIRDACDDLATRAGLLLTATGIGVAIVAARLGELGPRSEGALWAVAIATAFGIITLSPWLKIGPRASSLQRWMSGGANVRSSSLLYDFKVALLEANTIRLTVMRTCFMFQAVATIVAVVITLASSAGK
jgi:hypothetical protein